MAKKGFYAVRKGYKTGIFTDWDSCQRQVNGYSGSEFKKHPTREEALRYLNGVHSTVPVLRSGSIAKPSSRVKFSQGSHRSYSVNLRYKRRLDDNSETDNSETDKIQSHNIDKYKNENNNKKSKGLIEYQRGVSALVPKYSDVVKDEDSGFHDTQHIYTDGAAKSNGSTNAVAGFGCYFGENDERNYSGIVSGAQTNQRAELSALLHALNTVDKEFDTGLKNPYTILSDSKYSLSCINEWGDKWAKNGWKKSDGGKIINLDLIKECIKKKNSINEKSKQSGLLPIRFVHVPGHKGIHGNEQADLLANRGCNQSIND